MQEAHVSLIFASLREKNPTKESVFKAMHDEAHGWKVNDADAIRQLVQAHALVTDFETQELIEDLTHFGRTKRLRREDIWDKTP